MTLDSRFRIVPIVEGRYRRRTLSDLPTAEGNPPMSNKKAAPAKKTAGKKAASLKKTESKKTAGKKAGPPKKAASLKKTAAKKTLSKKTPAKKAVAKQPEVKKPPETREIRLKDPSFFLNREIAWLEFNRRVLEEACDPLNPAMEKLKFISIFSSNLDEFFQVRVGALQDRQGADNAVVMLVAYHMASLSQR